MDKEGIGRRGGGGGSSARSRMWLGMEKNTIDILKHLK